MTATYVQNGSAIDYVNSGSSKISAGDAVSLTTRIGVAGCDIDVGAVGTLHMDGVFDMPKGSAAIALGAAVYLDATSNVITATATSNTPAGYAVAAAAAADTTVRVKLLG